MRFVDREGGVARKRLPTVGERSTGRTSAKDNAQKDTSTRRMKGEKESIQRKCRPGKLGQLGKGKAPCVPPKCHRGQELLRNNTSSGLVMHKGLSKPL
jgi:hypothetical protein